MFEEEVRIEESGEGKGTDELIKFVSFMNKFMSSKATDSTAVAPHKEKSEPFSKAVELVIEDRQVDMYVVTD